MQTDLRVKIWWQKWQRKLKFVMSFSRLHFKAFHSNCELKCPLHCTSTDKVSFGAFANVWNWTHSHPRKLHTLPLGCTFRGQQTVVYCCLQTPKIKQTFKPKQTKKTGKINENKNSWLLSRWQPGGNNFTEKSDKRHINFGPALLVNTTRKKNRMRLCLCDRVESLHLQESVWVMAECSAWVKTWFGNDFMKRHGKGREKTKGGADSISP